MAVEDATEIWELIERSESCLVCCMFGDAASLASSVLKRIFDDESHCEFDGGELHDMKEAAGMVFVQSLKELGRTSEVMIELKQIFHPITAIPVDVLLTGACIQMPEGPIDVETCLEDFLSKWKCVDEGYYTLLTEDSRVDYMAGCHYSSVMALDKYVEVVEVYVVRLLGRVLKDTDRAISWVERAALPDERRQDLLQVLHSLYDLNSPNSAHGSHLLEDKCDTQLTHERNLHLVDGSAETLKSQGALQGDKVPAQSVLKLYKRVEPCYWWFRTITFKFGRTRFVISNAKILLSCLCLITVYFVRRKRASLRRIVTRQFTSTKKALIDLWQLAFSYQVNPLAAVQPLPPATIHGNR